VEHVNTNQAEAAAGKEESKNLGAFLRTEREKMNLSQDQIAQKMHLRRFVIEAIENEAWDRLPPPVFVRGFIRSYARTLELDENKVLELYHLAAPPEKDTLRPVAVARPSHRGRTLFILGALAVVLCVFYYWHLKSSARDREYLAMVERSATVQREESLSGKTAKTVSDAVPATLPGRAPLTRDEVEPKQEEEPAGMDSTPAPEKATFPEGRLQADESPAVVSAPAPESRSPWLILKGEVKETTWVSIRVDGNEPKEYMFEPGAKPQWKGQKGFEIIIGNAAGVDLDFDGRSMKNLGRPGQVLRIRLP
jgi:cytoskeleton protein RodZ